jgi:pimeloyl-ACP methyl ester carboxylesterase
MNIWLVHGSYHGAWCWKFLMPELDKLGHRVYTLDLPIGDPSIGASGYADAVAEAIDAAESNRSLKDRDAGPPVIVGHSMSGLVIPLVAARRPVRRLVFLSAFLPRPGVSINQQRATEPIDAPQAPSTAEWTDLGQDVWSVGPATATEIFFHDAPPKMAAWAASQLRPQAYRVMNEITPLTEWPKVESAYILCRDDHAANPAWSRTAARERLGVEAIELDGGHSPFLTRPAELAHTIDAALR